MSRPTKPGSHCHDNLSRLYWERVPSGMSQEQFGAMYELGSQGMVSQYLRGVRPLNVDAAAKFAKGLQCTIEDISPQLAQHFRLTILPYLGKRIGRIALYCGAALFGLLGQFNNKSFAATLEAQNTVVSDVIHIVRQWLISVLSCETYIRRRC